VHPGEPPGDPEPGLVEVRDIGRDQGLADDAEAAAEPAGDPADHPGHRAGRDRHAEHLGDRLARAPAGQELAVPQVRAHRGDPRPVLHRALTPAGAVPEVTAPHEQRRETVRCSVTCARMSCGRSITCRRTVAVTGAPNSPLPQPAHRPGSWLTTSSGRPVISSVAPGCPFGRPGLRPDLPRSDRGAGLASPSPDGGIDEFRGFLPSRARSSDTWAASASTCSRSIPISVSLASITSRSRAFAARSAATSSATGGTLGTNHT
jgi:hypothetical protein